MPKKWTTKEVGAAIALAKYPDQTIADALNACLNAGVTASQVKSRIKREGVSRATRKPSTAKAAGKRFEREVADYLAGMLEDDRIDRMPLHGSKDRGDIAGVRLHGQRVVVECKNTAKMDLAGWLREMEAEMGNDDAAYGLVIHKRRGHGVAESYATTTLGQLLEMGWRA